MRALPGQSALVCGPTTIVRTPVRHRRRSQPDAVVAVTFRVDECTAQACTDLAFAQPSPLSGPSRAPPVRLNIMSDHRRAPDVAVGHSLETTFPGTMCRTTRTLGSIQPRRCQDPAG